MSSSNAQKLKGFLLGLTQNWGDRYTAKTSRCDAEHTEMRHQAERGSAEEPWGRGTPDGRAQGLGASTRSHPS